MENDDIIIGGDFNVAIEEYPFYENNFWIMRADSDGDSLWERVYYAERGGDNYEMKLLAGGNCLMAGDVREGRDRYTLRALCINTNGDSLWCRDYDSGDDRLQHLSATSDGGFFLFARTREWANDPVTAWVIKCDSLGNPQWEIRGNPNYFDYYCRVLELDSGDFLIWGKFDDGRLYRVAQVKKFSSEGEEIWHQTYDRGGLSSRIYWISPVDEGFEYIGQIRLRGWHAFVDDEGEIIEEETYEYEPPRPDIDIAGHGPRSEAMGLGDVYLADGSRFIVGEIRYRTAAWAMQTDRLGNPLWQWEADPDERFRHYRFHGAALAGDGNFIVTGYGLEGGISLLKMRNEFASAPEEDDPTVSDFVLYSAYPNPFNNSICVRYFVRMPGDVSIRIYNSSGQLIAQPQYWRATSGYCSYNWQPFDCPAGKYLILLNVNKQVEAIPVILLP